jgi:hypothetical protein
MCACAIISAAYAGDLRDPTQPPEAYPHEMSGYDIQIDAIFFNKDSRYSTVIIGGNKLSVGDKIMNATILEIKPHEIKLQDDNGVFIVAMHYSGIKSLTITKLPTTNKKKKL